MSYADGCAVHVRTVRGDSDDAECRHRVGHLAGLGEVTCEHLRREDSTVSLSRALPKRG